MPPITRYITTEMINVRTCIGVDCEIVTQLSYGDSFRALGQETDADGAIWYRSMIGTQTVWIAGWFTSTERPSAPTATPVPIPQSTQPPARNWNCNGNLYDCRDFASCADMRSYWNTCPGDPSRLDGDDNDGRPCEDRCG
ncbi:MAG: hypothetical protein JXA10_00400 [Anaerolineae bacterium]|nr:hypothetical protein [Anaerolineae bacterium]